MSDLLILCYHAVSEDWPTEFAVSPRRLEAQLAYFARRGYRAATLTEALSGYPAGKTLVVTFDDAFASVRERALPVLHRLGMPATVFVPTGYVTGAGALEWSSLGQWAGTRFEDELACMSWDDLRELSACGWEIGSHTKSHPKLTALGDDELALELCTSRESCEEELARPCRSFAYPFGAHDERVMGAVRDAGYESAVILDDLPAIPAASLVRRGRAHQPFGLLREGVYRHDGWVRLLVKSSPWARRARASRLGHLALRAV